MNVKTIAAAIGGSALIAGGVIGALQPALAWGSAKGASGDSPTTIVSVPGINGQLAGAPTVPSMTFGATVTATPAVVQAPSVIGNMGVVGGPAAEAPAPGVTPPKAAPAPQCIPDVYNPSCSIGLP